MYTITWAEDVCDELAKTDLFLIIGALFVFGFVSPLLGEKLRGKKRRA